MYKLLGQIYKYTWLYRINKKIKEFLAWRINFLLLRNYSVYGWDFIYNLFGLKSKIKMWKEVTLNNATLNVNSWNIYIWDYVFCWHNVCIITWTHDYTKFWKNRCDYPIQWNDITIEEWVRIWTNATILGPCKIWKNSVIAAWAVITKDVPPYSVVVWIPWKVLKTIHH